MAMAAIAMMVPVMGHAQAPALDATRIRALAEEAYVCGLPLVSTCASLRAFT